jgi:NNP family nitrate/nitrite transporter-like MFS transporter
MVSISFVSSLESLAAHLSLVKPGIPPSLIKMSLVQVKLIFKPDAEHFNVVEFTANALGGGWGNAGGGFTFIIMIALFNQLLADGLTPHVAWRAAFAIVPVPILLSVAAATLIFGTDHPAGKWSDRHKAVAAALSASDDQDDIEKGDKNNVQTTITAVTEKSQCLSLSLNLLINRLVIDIVSELDTAVNKPLTLDIAHQVIVNPLTWLPALAYATTFGYELAIDANLANVLYTLLKSSTFGQTKAGYVSLL